MSKRVLCKFFAHGACLKGENCEFSHDWKDPANNVCTFYQKGACAYGSRCRYDHVKVARPQSSGPSSSTNQYPYQVAESVNGDCPSGEASVYALPGVTSELSASSRPYVPPTRPVWSEAPSHTDLIDGTHVGEPNSSNMADVAMCSFAAAGNCPRGENCPHVHGDICPTCKKQCLHPFRPDEREEHMRSCEKKHKHLEALKHSQEIECSVCLERVLSKPTAAERKFGLLSECDHPFCISCIRNWRSSSPTSGMDVNSALRACPICRKLSYFVIPSVIWYATKEEKDEIVDSYKARLRSIDCKHFDFGNGTCPFGTSCFYKHFVKPGSVLWNSSLGLNSSRMHEYDTDSGYSSDDLDEVGMETSDDDGLEGESSGDELADAIIAAEAMAFLRMNSEFQMGENEEPENHSDEGSDDRSSNDDSSDDGSSGEALAQAYLAAEMRNFIRMFR